MDTIYHEMSEGSSGSAQDPPAGASPVSEGRQKGAPAGAPSSAALLLQGLTHLILDGTADANHRGRGLVRVAGSPDPHGSTV